MNRRTKFEVFSFLVPALTVFVMVIGFFALIWVEAKHREEDRIHARVVFCQELEKVKVVIRETLNQSIRESEGFLTANPNGSLGIPADVIRRSIERNRRTVKELAPVECERFARVTDLDLGRG